MYFFTFIFNEKLQFISVTYLWSNGVAKRSTICPDILYLREYGSSVPVFCGILSLWRPQRISMDTLYSLCTAFSVNFLYQSTEFFPVSIVASRVWRHTHMRRRRPVLLLYTNKTNTLAALRRRKTVFTSFHCFGRDDVMWMPLFSKIC